MLVLFAQFSPVRTYRKKIKIKNPVQLCLLLLPCCNVLNTNMTLNVRVSPDLISGHIYPQEYIFMASDVTLRSDPGARGPAYIHTSGATVYVCELHFVFLIRKCLTLILRCGRVASFYDTVRSLLMDW